jgi:hypothetical protein
MAQFMICQMNQLNLYKISFVVFFCKKSLICLHTLLLFLPTANGASDAALSPPVLVLVGLLHPFSHP